MSQGASGNKSSNNKLFIKAFLMSLGVMLSRILGLFRDIAMAALFDRTVTDAWSAAFRIPNFFRRILGEGAVSASFIPVFIELRDIDGDCDQTRLRNFINGFYSLILIVATLASLSAIYWTPQILQVILDPAYQMNVYKMGLTIKMAQIMFGFVFFVTMYAYYMGILHALGEFAWPSFVPALLNISMLIFTFLPTAWFGIDGEGLAWGVLVGGALQALCLMPVLLSKKYFPDWSWQIWTQDVRRLLKTLLPAILGIGIGQILILINLYFTSSLEEGTVSAIYWADRLLELPLSLVSVSLGSALLPVITELIQKNQKQEAIKLQSQSLIDSGFWIVPAAVGLFALSEPIVEFLFYRGQFTSADLLRTSMVLKVYSISMLLLSLIRVLLPLLYASNKHKLVWGISIITLLIHIFVVANNIEQFGLSAVLWSSVLSLFFNLVFLFLGVQLFIGKLYWQQILKKYLLYIVMCFPMFAYGFFYQQILKFVNVSHKIFFIGSFAGMLIIYLGLGFLFRAHDKLNIKKIKLLMRDRLS